MQAAFAAPKALPGQRGHYRRESDRLAVESKVMEQRLRRLQLQILEERDREKQTAEDSGADFGSRWRGGRPPEVSARLYQRNAAGQPVPTPSSSAAKANPTGFASRCRGQDPNKAPGALVEKEAKTWSVDEVCDWLAWLGLDAYSGKFRDNLISGEILLDVGLEDLDYMRIRALAHRKVLLKGIEDLRLNGRVTLSSADQIARRPLSARGAKLTAPSSNTPSETAPAERVASEAVAKVPATTVHWSQVPVMSNEKTEEESQSLGDGHIDEEAEQAAFRAAVEEWRQGGQIRIVSEEQDAAERREEAMKVPTASNDNRETVQNATELKVLTANPRAASSLARVGGGALSFTFPESDDVAEATLENVLRPESNASLLEGELDEAAEHEKFKAAVAAWRARDEGTGTQSSATGTQWIEHETQKAAEELRRVLDEKWNACKVKAELDKTVAEAELRRLEKELGSIRQQTEAITLVDLEGEEETKDNEPDSSKNLVNVKGEANATETDEELCSSKIVLEVLEGSEDGANRTHLDSLEYTVEEIEED